MKKNIILLVLMFVLCVGLFMPCSVFAREDRIYNNIGINYRFSVQDENGNDVKDLKFRLYDKTGSLSFESEYDEDKNEYVFNENEFFYKHVDSFFYERLSPIVSENEADFRDYVNYGDILSNIVDEQSFRTFLENYNLSGKCVLGGGIKDYFNYYDYVPLILEDNIGNKKILLASLNNFFLKYNHSEGYYYVGVYLYNNLLLSDDVLDLIAGVYGYYSYEENVEFMRSAVYDYSDELWEQLNNGPIASSEMNYDDSSVVLDGQNLDLTKASILRFNKKDNVIKDDDSKSNDIDSNKSDNIINKITNPKTWNNGVVILVISMIIIIGSSFILIKRKNN